MTFCLILIARNCLSLFLHFYYIIHSVLKPSNILLITDLEFDFLAKMLGFNEKWKSLFFAIFPTFSIILSWCIIKLLIKALFK